MGEKRPLLYTVGLSLCHAFSLAAQEKPQPVEVQGDFLEFKNAREIVTIKGQVLATYKEYTIECDTMQVNIKKERLFAYGNVKVLQNQDEIRGTFFVYDMKTGDGYIRDGVIHKGVQIIRASEMIFSPDEIHGHNLLQTTCDNEEPDFAIKVKELINIPDQKNIMKGQSLIVGGKRILARGVTVSSAAPPSSKAPAQAEAPKGQGYSPQKGLFYNFSNKMTLGGNHGGYSAQLTQKQGNRGSWDFNYQGGRFGNGLYGGSYYHNPAREQTNATQNFSNSGKVPFQGQIPLIGEWLKDPTYNFSGNYYSDQLGADPANEELTTNLSVRGKLRGNDFTAEFSRRIDPDKEKNTQDNNLQYINKNPEITLRTQPFTVPGSQLTVTTDINYAKLFESRVQKETTKREVNFNFANPNIDMGPKMNVNLSGSYKTSRYSEGEERDIAQASVRTAQKWAHGLNSQINYDLENVRGKSPLSFDNRATRNRVQTAIDYTRSKRVNGTLLNLTWDMDADQLQNIYQNFKIIQKDEEKSYPWEVNIRPSYTLKTKASQLKMREFRLENLNTQFRLDRENYKLDLNGFYSAEESRFTAFNTNLTMTLNRATNLGLNGRFDTADRKFSALDLGLNRDFHCWETKFNYNKQREEFFLTFNLKAYPQDSGIFRYDAKEGKFQPRFSTFDSFSSRLREQADRLKSGQFAQDTLSSRTGVQVAR